MTIKILYDNEAKEGFKGGWGFSALVDHTTLFDMGEDAGSLLANMQAFGVTPEQIQHVILSHEDGDHVGGLTLLKYCHSVKVYVPAGASRALKRDIATLNPRAAVFEVLYNTTLDSDKFVTATLGKEKKEISLAIRTGKGLVLVTGCAHPGLKKIMEAVRPCGRIHAVMGGFHDFSELECLSDVSFVGPCHCTKEKHTILEMYPASAQSITAGTEIHFEETP